MFKCCVCHGKTSRRTKETEEFGDTPSPVNGLSEPKTHDEISDSEMEQESQKLENEDAEKLALEEEKVEKVVDEAVPVDIDNVDKQKTDEIEGMIRDELVNDLSEEADIVQELKDIIESINDIADEKPLKSNEDTSDVQPIFESRKTPEKRKESSEEEYPKDFIGESINQQNISSFVEVEIIDGIKKSDVHKKIEESYSVNDYTARENNVQDKDRVSQVENEIAAKTLSEAFSSDLLNIPPPATPPPEESIDQDKQDESSTELDFPTPPPADFDIPESALENKQEQEDNYAKSPGPPMPPWEDETESSPQSHRKLNNLLPMLSREDSKLSSPGSKSLPSPPSPESPSDFGNETEVESKSSSDEQTTKIKPYPLKMSCKVRSIDHVTDDEPDDSVFEAASLAKDPEIVKDIPPRPVPPVPRWLSQEEDEPEPNKCSEGFGGMQEPPATPVARDELAMRRHRFFSDLLQAARSTAEHRVSFDPLGPMVHPGCDEREEHLEELVNRLENVTKRLEQVSASHQQKLLTPFHTQAAAAPSSPVQTQEIAVQTKSPSPERSLSLESEQSSSSSRASTHSSSVASVVEVVKSMSLSAYEDILAGPFQDYLQYSQKIGGDVATHSKLVDKAFQIQLQFLKTAASRPAPTSQSEQVSLLGPTSAQIQEIQEFREKHRGSPLFNHLSAISESIPALGWVAVSPTPAPYVKEMNDAGQFYTNRVLKDWKEKDKTHVEWCKAWVKILTDLQQFVRQHHTTGLVWAKTGSVPPSGGVPPPPPPCMMPMADPAPVIGDDRSALFAEINQGENITKNLKKVTSDMQTHKNTNLRTGPAPFKAPVVSNNSPVKSSPANAPIDKPPVFTRDGKKWLVEYHKGNKNLVIDNVEMNNVVYMFRCQDSNLVIKGKINSVVMDSCRKSAVVIDSVVASIEFVNCQSVQMQVLGKVPTISIDKTDGCQMYLNNDTLDVELITSKSSEMNVMVPIGNNDYTEYPVPEQFKTRISEKGLTTVAVDSLG
ncbi:hypothetical protein QAD02_001840 [Eretmocerus hayati]|uniref:Uncharacterized protein n=1 Tax=Eretmocerus hayati TaxID=131215 RepID=A0ACC2NHK2_9HYME|nr:hypothetical protein QAD02_001840 [Eretmocerus hayati]